MEKIEDLTFRQVMEEYYQLRNEILSSIPASTLERHRSRNKRLARERIALLTDEGSPFLELSLFAAYGMYEGQFPYAGIVTGVGWVYGKPTVVIANEGTIKGGTYVHETIRKHIRALEIALELRLPVVSMADSGGIFLPEQARVFPDRFDFGRIFYLQAKLSAAGIPQLAIAFGMCTAGGAYVPAMADENIMVEGNGSIFLAGPPLVKAATGEIISAEELGGARVHGTISGVADHIVPDEYVALKRCREILAVCNSGTQPLPPLLASIPGVYRYISPDNPFSSDMEGILACLLDADSGYSFKPDFGKNILTQFATLGGIHIGVIANKGYLDIDAARKASHFIELCEQRRIPILFVQNINGFVVGSSHEHNAIASAGARLIHIVANCTVPKITLIAGGSFGAGNYAMAGRAFDPDFVFTWPGSEVAVMGPRQVAAVVGSVGLGKDTESLNRLEEQIEQESSCYYASARLWDDGIIDPADTPSILAICFSLVSRKLITSREIGVLRM